MNRENTKMYFEKPVSFPDAEDNSKHFQLVPFRDSLQLISEEWAHFP